MSFLVSMKREDYQDGALNSFSATGGYRLDNARAMMWLSQLAYDTDDRGKVEGVLAAWNLRLRAFRTNDPITGFPIRSACALVAAGRGATMVAFAGTDPLKISDWVTDFRTLPSATQLHSGFEDAVNTVWSEGYLRR